MKRPKQKRRKVHCMRIWLGIVALAAAFMAAGCRDKTSLSKPIEAAESDVGIMYPGYTLFDGGYLTEIGTLDQMMVYFDYDEKALFPLCTKADCSHRPGDLTCTAVLLAKGSDSRICIYQGCRIRKERS